MTWCYGETMGRTGQLENLTAKRIFSAYRVACIMLRYGFMRNVIKVVTDMDVRQIRKVVDMVDKYSDACTDKVNTRTSFIYGLLQSEDALRVNEDITLYTMLHRAKVTQCGDIHALIAAWLSVNTYRRLNHLPYATAPVNINLLWKIGSFLNLRVAVMMRSCGIKFVHSSRFNLLYVKPSAINISARDVVAEIPSISVYHALELARKNISSCHEIKARVSINQRPGVS